MASLSRSSRAGSWPVPPRPNRSLIRPAGSRPGSVSDSAAEKFQMAWAARASGSSTDQSVKSAISVTSASSACSGWNFSLCWISTTFRPRSLAIRTGSV